MGRERTESRAAGGPQNKQNTAPRPRAPGVGNQREPETTGAPNGRKKKSKAPSGGNNSETQKRGGATAREQPTDRQHQTSESTRRAEKCKANKTNNTQRQGPPHPGLGTKESKRQSGRKRRNDGETKKKSKGGGEGKERTKTGATPARRGPSKAERQDGKRKR